MQRSIVSIGQATSLIQQMPDRIRWAASQLGIEPELRINSIDHFTESDLQRISDLLRSGGDSNLDRMATGLH